MSPIFTAINKNDAGRVKFDAGGGRGSGCGGAGGFIRGGPAADTAGYPEFVEGDLFEQAGASESGPAAFDFNREYMGVVRDVARACEEFGHIDADRIAVSYSQAKTNSKHGLQAKIYPLRFEGGAREKISKGYKFSIPPVYYDGVEIYYIISFCIPRFLNLSIGEKLETIVHELFHISPRFNGDIRRLSMGSKAAHGSSHEIFDRFVAKIVKRYLYSGSRSVLPKFLYMDYKKLRQAYGEIKLEKLKIPKIITERAG